MQFHIEIVLMWANEGADDTKEDYLQTRGGKDGLEKARSKGASKRKIDFKLFAIFVAIACLLLFVFFGCVIIRSAACTYVMTDGERYETVRLYPGSVEEACNKAGFRNVEVVNRKDDDGIVYLTLKATFDVSIQTSEETLTVRTAPCTVGELLEANGISVGSDDIVTPDVDDWLSDSRQVTVTRVSYSTVTETEDVPFSVEVQYDSQMLKGQQEIARYGENGEKSLEYRVEEHDGEEVSRELVKEEEVKPPVNCIVKQGIALPRTHRRSRRLRRSPKQRQQAARPYRRVNRKAKAPGSCLPQAVHRFGLSQQELLTTRRIRSLQPVMAQAMNIQRSLT